MALSDKDRLTNLTPDRWGEPSKRGKNRENAEKIVRLDYFAILLDDFFVKKAALL